MPDRMKKLLMAGILYLLIGTASSAQDTLVTKLDERMAVTEVYTEDDIVRFKKSDAPESKASKLKLKDVRYIFYKDGTRDFYDSHGKRHNSEEEADLSDRGRKDAEKYYKGKNCGAMFVGLSAICLTPVLGLIPAVSVANASPRYKNLEYPDEQLMEKQAYKDSYVETAHQKKKNLVWISYGVGTAFFITAIIVTQ
jgi:hypothetical protein